MDFFSTSGLVMTMGIITKLFMGAVAAAIIAYLTLLYYPQADTRYVFLAEWYDPVSGTVKNFHLSFFPKDKAVEMFDLRTQRIFLKRLPVGLDEREFYVGNTVVVLSRQLKIVNYADPRTKEEIGSRRQKTFAMIKPDAVHKIGEIINNIQVNGFEISQLKMVQLSRDLAAQFYQEHHGKTFFEGLLAYISGGPVVALELITSNAVKKWRDALGPTDAEAARTEAPESIRAKYGSDKQVNAAHGSDSDASASREIEFFFPTDKTGSLYGPHNTAKFGNTTCCIIKPHAIAEGNLGSILIALGQDGFEISAAQMFRVTKLQAEEFLEIYKGIVPEYPGMVQQLISGPSVVMEIRSNHGIDTPTKFRELVGPPDPTVARELRPRSLRARYGLDKVKNALHCSDLPDDGVLEVEYFFKILQ